MTILVGCIGLRRVDLRRVRVGAMIVNCQVSDTQDTRHKTVSDRWCDSNCNCTQGSANEDFAVNLVSLMKGSQ